MFGYVITDEAIKLAINAMPGDFEIISEDDNRYCNPPRTRLLNDEETREGVKEMLEAAIPNLYEAWAKDRLDGVAECIRNAPRNKDYVNAAEALGLDPERYES